MDIKPISPKHEPPRKGSSSSVNSEDVIFEFFDYTPKINYINTLTHSFRCGMSGSVKKFSLFGIIPGVFVGAGNGLIDLATRKNSPTEKPEFISRLKRFKRLSQSKNEEDQRQFSNYIQQMKDAYQPSSRQSRSSEFLIECLNKRVNLEHQYSAVAYYVDSSSNNQGKRLHQIVVGVIMSIK